MLKAAGAVQPEPWALGVRLRAEPDGVHRLRVTPVAATDGMTVAELTDEIGDMWVSIVVRDRVLVAVRDDARLKAGDEVIVLADPELHDTLAAAFATPG